MWLAYPLLEKETRSRLQTWYSQLHFQAATPLFSSPAVLVGISGIAAADRTIPSSMSDE